MMSTHGVVCPQPKSQVVIVCPSRPLMASHAGNFEGAMHIVAKLPATCLVSRPCRRVVSGTLLTRSPSGQVASLSRLCYGRAMTLAVGTSQGIILQRVAAGFHVIRSHAWAYTFATSLTMMRIPIQPIPCMPPDSSNYIDIIVSSLPLTDMCYSRWRDMWQYKEYIISTCGSRMQ